MQFKVKLAMSNQLKILIVDDDQADRNNVRRLLKRAGLETEITEAADYEEAKEKMSNNLFDCVLIDYLLPDRDGLTLVREIRQQGVKIPLIILTGHGDEEIAVDMMKAGASDYLSKFRLTPSRLNQAMQNALRIYEAEQEAAIAKQEKEHLAKQKEDFIARMTHDLRTPLVSANHILELFKEGLYGEITPEMSRVIQVIIRSNKNLLEMVSNLLEVYFHENGEKKLNFTKFKIIDLLEEVFQELAPLAREKGLELSLNAENTGEIFLNGDVLELRRVFSNLISNGIKFTEQGYVKIHLIPATEEDAFVTIVIEDTGIGIAAEELPRIFERLYSGSVETSTSGLGLYLSRRIIDAHGGTISVTSELERGSSFSVRLPAYNDR
ncbi:hybrid sensor histidine kinase/response regulator [Microcystis aeruginosa]|uniref:hybrid sensor histidine kinase/response regulator n=1 Tax=Microcystis aeruginosa TaxID=1126 RepID=UPI00232CA1A2|nr:hybrid sensor histidine kinase/response regulator [Microcystis aeruginosa]MDB9433503.1 hybrid sensor histidine kinase/response regulator [Microcystis aeruginosa CS-552/01]